MVLLRILARKFRGVNRGLIMHSAIAVWLPCLCPRVTLEAVLRHFWFTLCMSFSMSTTIDTVCTTGRAECMWRHVTVLVGMGITCSLAPIIDQYRRLRRGTVVVMRRLTSHAPATVSSASTDDSSPRIFFKATSELSLLPDMDL